MLGGVLGFQPKCASKGKIFVVFIYSFEIDIL